MNKALEKKEQAHQITRTEAWTISLQGDVSYGESSSLGRRKGDMILDADGRIWVAGGPSGLEGLHVFDGSGWTSFEGNYNDLALSPQGQVWAVREYGGIDVFDEVKVTTYTTADLGIEEEDIEQVEVAMTRSQVRFLLGTPMVSDPFAPHRWDYVYRMEYGRQRSIDSAHSIVHFEGDKVVKVEMLDEIGPSRRVADVGTRKD